MASVNWQATVRWGQQTLNADATFLALLVDGRVHARTIPNIAIVARPAALVALQSTAPPTGPLRTGATTYTAQEIIWRLHLRQRTHSTVALEQAAARALALLDGQYYQTVTGGMVYQNLYLTTTELVDAVGDEQVIMWNLLFQAYTKAT